MISVEMLANIEAFFANYPFLQECLTVSLGVIFGGALTVLINRGSIRKQCYFELQYNEIRSLIDYLKNLEKAVEGLEITISFNKMIEPHEQDKEIQKVESGILGLNELFREKRPLIHKYLTGTMLSESANLPIDWYKTFYNAPSPSFAEMTFKENFGRDDIKTLRSITVQIGLFKNQLTNSLEKLIFPGWIATVKRKFNAIKIVAGNIFGMWRTSNKDKEGE